MRAGMVTGPARWLAMTAIGLLGTGAAPAPKPAPSAPKPNAAPILAPAQPTQRPPPGAASAAAATGAAAATAAGASPPSPEVQAAVTKANAGQPEDLFKLADQGRADAQYFAGGILIFGLGKIPRDPAKGCAYEEKASATRGDAAHLLGECYRRGLAGHLDKAKAAAAYERAISLGYTKSKCVLGEMLFADPAQADRGLLLCKGPADAGDVEAQTKVAGFYYRGSGKLKPDKTLARTYYEKAAAQNNLEARRRLGEMYAKGEGGARDGKKAMAQWTAAEKAGDPMVSILVADYLFGQISGGKPPGPGQYAFKGGVPVADIEVVEDWYKQAQARDPRPDVQQRAKYALSVLGSLKSAAVQVNKSGSSSKSASKGAKSPPTGTKPPPPPPPKP